MRDGSLGSILVVVSVSFAVYYTAWVIGLPFAEPEHSIHWLFPSCDYALMVPALMGLVFIGSLIIFTVYSIKTSPD